MVEPWVWGGRDSIWERVSAVGHGLAGNCAGISNQSLEAARRADIQRLHIPFWFLFLFLLVVVVLIVVVVEIFVVEILVEFVFV